jgi:uncharacterized protein (TIGR03437 family)
MHTAIGILSIIAAGFLALLVHESGHLAGGLSAGFRFQLLTVGLMTIVREGERIRFRWNLDWKLMGGIASPILALSNVGGAESIVVQAPCELAPGRTSVVIRSPGAQAQVDNVQVFRGAPGLFETPASGSQRAYAAIVRPDGSYVTPTNPALRGEVVLAAVTGLGQTTPAASTNRVGNGSQQVAAPLVVGVNDQGVRIVSATYAPGMIGVYWVAFEIPADTTPGLYRSFAIAVDQGNGELVFGNGSSIAAIQ